MIIKSAHLIEKNYDTISNLCKNTQQPIYLTKNGEIDLVVMDIHAFEQREAILQLKEELISVEEQRLNGGKEYTLDEVKNKLYESIK